MEHPKTIPMSNQTYGNVLNALAIIKSATKIANIVSNASVDENEQSCVMYGITTMLETAAGLLDEILAP